MSESTLQDQPPASPPRRRRRRLVVGAAVLVAAVAAVSIYFIVTSDRDIREAVAEADRLDPGWRFDDLEAARPDVPDAENGATLVLSARALMPAAWPAGPVGGRPGLSERIPELPPAQRLNAEDLAELRAELEKVAAALDVARGLADRPRGRYTVAWTSDLFNTWMKHVQDVRDVALLLAFDALLRALDGDGDGACRSCQAALNAGRSLGDEPTPISQLVRVSGVRLALTALEQSLAQAQMSDRPLADLQRLLALEAEEPVHLIAARANRVNYYQCLEAMRTGQFDQAAFGLRSSVLGPKGDALLDRGKARACEAAYLRYSNELVETAKLPVEKQQERLEALRPPKEPLPRLLAAFSRGSEWPKQAQSFHRTQAELRCASAALAAERYRMAERRWPETLDALVPRFLTAVPADPFDGKPLRMRRLPDGLVIYSVGPDRTDDRGQLDRKRTGTAGTDVGFQLWDVDRRGKDNKD
jgi:hypothetical protein